MIETEFLGPYGSASAPELPWPIYGHCMIYLKEKEKVLIIGGYHGRLNDQMGFSSDVWAYSWDDTTNIEVNIGF